MTEAYVYDADGRDRAVSDDEACRIAAALGERQLLWIDVTRAEGMSAGLGEALGLEPEAWRIPREAGGARGLTSQGRQFGFGLPLPDANRLDFMVGPGTACHRARWRHPISARLP